MIPTNLLLYIFKLFSFMGLLPKQISNFAITYKCNSKCLNCNIWKKPINRSELSLNEIKLFFQNNNLLKKVKSLQLTGGEPFLRDDLPSIIQTINSSNPNSSIWIPTNALIPDRISYMVERILQCKSSLGISVSVDGIGKTNDFHRGITGSYKKALRTIKNLSEIRKSYQGLRLSIGFTLSPNNFNEVNKVQELAYEHDFDFSLRPVNISQIYYENERRLFYDHEVEKILKDVSNSTIKRKGWLGSLTFLAYVRGIPRFLRDPKDRAISCSAGTRSFFLDPYGNIFPCIVFNRKMGNIREKSFNEIWYSPKTEEIRREIYEKKCPGCWLECETFRDISNDEKYLAETFLNTVLKGSPF
jgi:MoaA/NifB/PqqE/SkfB family radical SAM enzyme